MAASIQPPGPKLPSTSDGGYDRTAAPILTSAGRIGTGQGRPRLFFVGTFDRLIQIGRRKHEIAATEIKTQRRGRLREFRFRIKDATQKLYCTRRSTRVATNNIAAIPEWLGNTTDAVKKSDRVIG